MKTKIFLLLIIISFAGLLAQQKEPTKLQKADESGFVEVDKAPELLTSLKPEYPELAKLAGIQGTVYLKLLVDEEGNVAETKVVKSVKDMLDESALNAVKKAKFSPAILKNKPIKVWVVLPVAFKLSLDKEEPKIIGPGIKAPATNSDDDPGIETFVKYEKAPKMIEASKPEYPALAKNAGITGKVFVKVLVDKDGTPKKAVVIKSESELFNESAVAAAMKSKFTPAVNKGEALAVWIVLPYKFTLGDSEKGETELFETVEKAREDFKKWKAFAEMSEVDMEKMTGKKMKFEKLNGIISFGDESIVYKGTANKKVKYGFLALNGNKVYKYNAATLEDIKKYVNDLKTRNENQKKLEDSKK